MKNKKVVLIARFSVPNFKVPVELLKSYIVAVQKKNSNPILENRKMQVQFPSEHAPLVTYREDE